MQLSKGKCHLQAKMFPSDKHQRTHITCSHEQLSWDINLPTWLLHYSAKSQHRVSAVYPWRYCSFGFICRGFIMSLYHCVGEEKILFVIVTALQKLYQLSSNMLFEQEYPSILLVDSKKQIEVNGKAVRKWPAYDENSCTVYSTTGVQCVRIDTFDLCRLGDITASQNCSYFLTCMC